MLKSSEVPHENLILIVDDVADQRQLMSIFMGRLGYEVAEASDGMEALELAHRAQPALIISDISMPGVDGIELTRMIRSSDVLAETPILLVSAIQLGDENVRAGFDEGADDYVEVPYDPTDFAVRAVKLLERARSVAALRASEQAKAQALEDLHLKEEQLLLSQKLEAVGRLAAGIAHDFNNLLTVIEGYSQLALQRLPSESPVRANIEEVKKASKRAAVLVSQLLAFSRKQVMRPKVFDLNETVTNIEKMLRRVIGEDIDLRTRLQPDLGTIKADPGQIEQVIMNLVVNGRDAMPSGGKLTLETANVSLGETYAKGHIAVLPGHYVMLAVSDTGGGMDEETQGRVFEPFFTTKQPGRGTGLGLSTVYGIVKQSGGNIWVYSEPGHGTTFKIYLPRLDGAAKDSEMVPADVAALGGSETILLVEDENSVRCLVRGILEEAGYDVLEASCGEEGLRLSNERLDPIDLLLTDVVMPEISGKEVADRLVSLRPGIKVLFMSGYTDEAIVHHGMLDSNVNFIQKPFSPAALARKVREVLDSNGKVSTV
jgi:two-component system cell cycle sensor histidine kinase/response regulator CckA